MKTKDYSRFEWVKVRTYLTIINGRYAFETLYKKVYHQFELTLVAMQLFYFPQAIFLATVNIAKDY